ncbi:MAG: hypothetical protein Fues2KO_19560 [Fuerstiella sp.]
MKRSSAGQRVQTVLKALPLLVVGAVIGAIVSQADISSAVAQQRRPEPPVAFKSGGERAAETLEKISRQIEKLDQRLANIEATVVVPKSGRK